MERISKSYRFKKDAVDKLELIRVTLEKELGSKVSGTAAIEILINKYYNENLK